MACTIDHLSLHRRITVVRGFTDARGVVHQPGETGVISKIELDWAQREISVSWDREGSDETMVFDLTATEGPGNGRMREYFEAGELEIPADPDRRFVEGIGLVSTLAPDLPPLSEEPVTDPTQIDAGIDRIHALAGRDRFEEAARQLEALSSFATDQVAASLSKLAETYAFEPSGERYRWLRDRAIQTWYFWGAQATSGGEGSARMLDIHPAMERFKLLDRARAAAGLPNE